MLYPELSLWLIVVNTEWYSWHQITDPCYQGNNSESLRSPFCGFVRETCHFFFFYLCFEDALAVCVHSWYFLHLRSCVINNKHIVTRGVNYSPPVNAPSLKNWISILQKNLLKVYILKTTTMLRINCANRIVRATRQKNHSHSSATGFKMVWVLGVPTRVNCWSSRVAYAQRWAPKENELPCELAAFIQTMMQRLDTK